MGIHKESSINLSKLAGSIYRAIAHGLSRAVIRVVQGGKALGGFLSGFAGSLFGGFAKDLDNVDTITKTIMVAIAGGTASMLGGGKFANGAMSAAFIFMFNEMGKRLVLDARSKAALQKIRGYLKVSKVTQYTVAVGKYTVDLIRGNPIGDILEMRGIAKGEQSSWELAAEAVSAIPKVAEFRINEIAMDMITQYEIENNYELKTFWQGVYHAH